MPVRIQRQRTKGWKMPENTVYVGRPTVWGNRWKVGNASLYLRKTIETDAEAVECYRKLFIEKMPDFQAFVREKLRGKDLACWCPLNQPCHADVLLEIANR